MLLLLLLLLMQRHRQGLKQRVLLMQGMQRYSSSSRLSGTRSRGTWGCQMATRQHCALATAGSSWK
jgi:hypothetical protein